jgi:glycosyltransferase involved in cell wall biosynthesis
MSAAPDLTAIILARDEEPHLARCIASIRETASRVIVVDSGSTDRTREVARQHGADVLEHPFENYGRQFNWALAHGAVGTAWVMRLDADEYVLPCDAATLRERLIHAPADAAAFTLRLRRIFMGRWLRHGGLYPIRLLRIWRTGAGRCEERWMDEHILVEGRVVDLPVDFADHNLRSITWWTDKHNRYASREALDQLLAAGSGAPRGRAGAKRWTKRHVYGRLPLGLRALLYFLYRYVARLGFLDGWPGFVFHFLQACWYRTLVDVKIRETREAMARGAIGLEQAAREVLGIDVTGAEAEAGIAHIGHHHGAQPARHDPGRP